MVRWHKPKKEIIYPPRPKVSYLSLDVSSRLKQPRFFIHILDPKDTIIADTKLQSQGLYFPNSYNKLLKNTKRLLDYPDKSANLEQTNSTRQRSYPFVNYFLAKGIPLPAIFKSTPSLRRFASKSTVVKLINLIMKRGKKQHIQRVIVSSVWRLSREFSTLTRRTSTSRNWMNIAAFFYANSTVNGKRKIDFYCKNRIKLSQMTALSLAGKIFSEKLNLFALLSKRVAEVNPLFQLKFHRTDKKMRKFSRGKLPKYFSLLQYVAPYKRQNLSLRWLVSDMMFDKAPTFKMRFNTSFTTMMTDPQQSYAFKTRRRIMRLVKQDYLRKAIKFGTYRIRR